MMHLAMEVAEEDEAEDMEGLLPIDQVRRSRGRPQKADPVKPSHSL